MELQEQYSYIPAFGEQAQVLRYDTLPSFVKKKILMIHLWTPPNRAEFLGRSVYYRW